MYFIYCLSIVDQNGWIVLISTEFNDQLKIVKANRDEFRAASNQTKQLCSLKMLD
jgi:hypothetical protein